MDTGKQLLEFMWSIKNKPTNPKTRAAKTVLKEKSKGEELTHLTSRLTKRYSN